nr:flavodoxin [Lachnospiraceae bacterium]
MNDPSARPEIAGTVSDMASYEKVIIGFPIWWGVAPRIIETFLESYDFSGKTIIP